MDTLNRLRKALPAKNQRAELERVAAATQVPYHTLLKIVNGATTSPRYTTVERLLKHVERKRKAA